MQRSQSEEDLQQALEMSMFDRENNFYSDPETIKALGDSRQEYMEAYHEETARAMQMSLQMSALENKITNSSRIQI